MAISDQVFRTALQIHEALYKRTDGWVGHRLLGVPSLLLRTTGRRTGQQRTNALSYSRDGNRYLVVGSKGGADTSPAWLLNLRAQPEVEIQVGRERKHATATEIGHDDPDFERVWKLVNDGNANRYTAYQKKTQRPIPVVALTPA